MSAVDWIWLLVAGVVGVGLRAVLVWWWGPSAFPWATLVVNGVGGLAMGYVQSQVTYSSQLKFIVGAGLLGGLTTFSAFAWDSLRLLQSGSVLLFAANVTVNNLLAVGLCAIGFFLGRSAA